ncbi:MAG: zinc-ribbon and DUF3426 domain-containing protein [Caldimonas sp.]
MSLATRCTSCGTVFRVAQDQLKVSEGWVRCGRCDAVFNALEGLLDLDRETPAEWDEGAPPSPGPERAPPAVAGLAAADDDAARHQERSDAYATTSPASLGDLLADPIDAHLFRNRRAESDKSPPVQVDERDRLEFSDARFDSDLFAENASADPALIESLSSGVGDLPLESAHQQPDFLRRAERRARWRSRPARLGLAAVCGVGGLFLVLQVGHHFRDTLAAQWPATRPLLAAWCQAADCALEAPRRIDEVLVDSSALTRAIGLDAFVLSVTLKSRSSLPLTLPSVDLSLTHGHGRLIARRALSPRDFGAASVIQPGAETAMQLMLNAGGARVAGYTVEIFYP